MNERSAAAYYSFHSHYGLQIIASLTFDNEANMTPPKFNNSVMGASTMPMFVKSSGPIALQASATAPRTDLGSPTIAPTANNQPSPFLTNILRNRTGSGTAITRAPQESPPSTSLSIKSQSSAVAIPQETPSDAATTPPPRTTLPLAKSILSSRLGSSKKRRQSSDFPQLSRPPAASGSTSDGSELVVRKETSNPFEDTEDNYMPGTTSKRRRMDVSQPLLALENKEYDRDNTLNLRTTLFSPKTPDSKLAKPSRSTGLTLHDLRDPTPKPSKTHDLNCGSPMDKPLPIMFLHTPQRKKLFEKKYALLEGTLSKSPGLSPSKSNPHSSILPTTPAKTSLFGSSIFSRFSIGSAPDPREKSGDLSPTKIQKPSSAPDRPSAIIGTSPKSPTKPGSLLRRLSLKTVTSVKSSMDVSTTVGRLLSGNSVTLDRASHSGQESNATGATEQPAITFVTPPKLSRPTTAGAKPTRAQEGEQRSTEATPATNVSSHPSSGTSLSTPSPWGRPPSWKPKSPRMIDMEKKRLAERTARLAKKSGPIPLPMDSHSKQPLGSLKVSVYGKSMNMISSMSSLSSRSTVSGRSSSSVYNKSFDTLPGDNSLLEEEEDEDDEDDDTGRISPTAISPIKGSHQFLQSTFQPFSSMFSTRSSTFARSIVQPKATHTSNPPQSVTRVSGKLPRPKLNRSFVESRPIVSTAAATVSSHDPLLEQERQRILDGPMEEFRSRHGEDDTVLNTALQSIFDGSSSSKQGSRNAETPTSRGPQQLSDSQGSAVGLHFDENDGGGGLFDEGMPDGLDLNEALWETTEVFS